ncbi:hypothetical protein Hanom_Chr06g00529331 [Helianthus anomalus]
MLWFNNYLFSEYFDESIVPDTYDSSAQEGYSNYRYRGEPYPLVEYLYVQPNCPDHSYGD